MSQWLSTIVRTDELESLVEQLVNME